MRTSKFGWVAVAAACALLWPIAGTPASAEDEAVDVVEAVKVEMVQQLQFVARDDLAQAELYAALQKQGVVDAATVLADSKSDAGQKFTQWAVNADGKVKELMGLPEMQANALQVYVAGPADGLGSGKPPLFASSPSNEEADVKLIAYDINGKEIVLDPKVAPDLPVLFASLDMGAIGEAATTAISVELKANGVLSDVLLPVDQPGPQGPKTRLDRIKINDIKEPYSGKWYCPWVLFGSDCNAEVLVFTMGGSGGTARVDLTSLTDVNEPDTTYYPMRTIVNWANFSWTNVDVLVMEMDWSTCSAPWSRYGQVVSDAIKAKASIPIYQPLAPIAQNALKDGKKICSALLAHVDLPDYIDSFNAVSQYTTGTQIGAANNANTTMTLVP